MQKSAIDKKKVRDQLRSKRNLLLEEYSKNPLNTHLAIEIKRLDDRLAELTEQLDQQKKSRPE